MMLTDEMTLCFCCIDVFVLSGVGNIQVLLLPSPFQTVC